MKKYIAALAALALLLICSSAFAGGGYTIENLTAGYTDIYNVANRTDEDITIRLKALVKYYPYDTDTKIEFKNGIGAPVTSVTVMTVDEDEIWSMTGDDLFKSSQTGGITSAANQSAFFEGRTNAANGPLFSGVKNEIIAAARRQGMTLSGFGKADSESGTITLNARTTEDTAEYKIRGIKIVYETKSAGADPFYSPTERTASEVYGEADYLKVSIGDDDEVLAISGGDLSKKDKHALLELNGTKVYEALLTCKPLGISGTVNITAELTNDEGHVVTANNAVIRMNTSFDFHAELGSDAGSQVITDSANLNVSNLAGTSADPAKANWNGKDLYSGGSDEVMNNPGPGRADKAKIASISTTAFTAGNFEDQSAVITIKGAAPNAWVYITKKDAKALFLDEDGEGPEENIYLTKQNIAQYGIPFRVTSFDQGEDAKNAESKLTLTFNGAKTAIKAFPLTVAVQNAAMKSPVTKTFKLSANPSAPINWKVQSIDEYGDEFTMTTKNTIELAVALSEDTDVDSGVLPPVFMVSGDGHYRITVSPAEKNGIEAYVTQPVFDAFGGVRTPGNVEFSGSVEIEDKESKTPFTLTATNTSTKKKTVLKVNVIGKIGATIINKVGSKDASGLRRINPKTTKKVEAGKVPSITLKAKGSKTIKWSLGDDDEYLDEESIDDNAYYAALLADVGLSFDRKTGKIKALNLAKNVLPTTNIDGDFASLDIVVHASNGYGAGDWAKMWVAVTGAKPALSTTKLTLNREDFKSGDIAGILQAKIGKTVITSADTKGVRIKFSPLNKKGNSEDIAALSELGLELLTYKGNSDYNNYGVLRVLEGGLKATKSKKISLLLDNLGAVNTGTLTLVINDPAPEIKTDRAYIVSTSAESVPAVILSGSRTAAVSTTVNLWISDETAPTNDSTKFAWKVQKPKGSSVKASVKADSASKGRNAVVTFTLPKNKLTAEESDFVIQATNNTNKKSGTLTVRVIANKSSGTNASSNNAARNISGYADNEAEYNVALEAKNESESYTDKFVRLGAPRTTEQLSNGHKAFVESEGYVVIAVLPEVTAEVEGQHEITAELDEDAPEGEKLIYLPFPVDAPEVEDDRIADFYDEEGAPIDEVPASRVITVDAWLRSGVTYQPVIAIEKK